MGALQSIRRKYSRPARLTTTKSRGARIALFTPREAHKLLTLEGRSNRAVKHASLLARKRVKTRGW